MNIDLNPSLVSSVTKFLNEKFVFRKLEIHEFFEHKHPPIFWIHRSCYSPEVDTMEACMLLDDQMLHYWQIYSKGTLALVFDEFQLWCFLKNLEKPAKRKSKEIIKALIETSELVQMIKFNPVLKNLIVQGRHKVSGVIPLHSTDSRRVRMDAKEGEVYYLCNDHSKPFIANPCYIVKSTMNGPYRVMYFTNAASQFIETKKSRVNAYGFTTVFPNELGVTPEQAVRQAQG
jgi:hypothetical protein